MWKIPLSIPYIDNEEINAVADVLKCKWLSMGDITADFEKTFAEKMNVKYAFAVSNCTVALHLANIVLEIGPGDEVICPALTFVASANASLYTRAKVVFANVISENDLTIDPVDIEKKITKKTKAITVVHYAGFACKMDVILELKKKYNLKIIEDCAHSPFAWHTFYDGSRKFTGSIGDVGCFSFFGNKNMTTGEGGMITTNNDEIAKKIKLLRSHGMTILSLDKYKGHASNYNINDLGYNYRIDDIRSAIGLVQLKKIDLINFRRRKLFKLYCNALKDNPNIIVPFMDRQLEESSCHIMSIIIKKKIEKIKAELKKHKIQTSKHYELISTFDLYKKTHFKNKIHNLNNLVTLPLYPQLKISQVKRIAEIINENS